MVAAAGSVVPIVGLIAGRLLLSRAGFSRAGLKLRPPVIVVFLMAERVIAGGGFPGWVGWSAAGVRSNSRVRLYLEVGLGCARAERVLVP